jgi:hypothetical protein
MPLINTAKEARNLVKDLIVANQGTLGIQYVGVDNERRLPSYPAVVISAGPREKELHATHTFAISFRVLIWVYHGVITVGHRTRSDQDLDLADAIETVLEQDMTFNGQVIHSWVESQIPGVFQPRAEKSDLVIGSRLVWMALSESRF